MSILNNLTPFVRIGLRGLIHNGPRTYSSRAYAPITTSLPSCFSQKKPSGNVWAQNSSYNQVRFKSTNSANTAVNDIPGAIPPAIEANPSSAMKVSDSSDIKWETIDTLPITQAPISDGHATIYPFLDLNIFQEIFFPYTYAIMYYLNFMTGIMPWWAAIVATTATIRIVFFPAILKSTILGIKAINIMPEQQKLNHQVTEAVLAGDNYRAAACRTKLVLLNEKNGTGIKSRILPILIQSPSYMVTFFLLRMQVQSNADALSTGGILWFTDLTAADPYLILPITTCISMWLLMEYGLEGGRRSAHLPGYMKWLMRAFPVGLFFAASQWPAAVLLFWSTSNLFTIMFSVSLKTALAKRIFKIPERIEIDFSQLPSAGLSFKESISNYRDVAMKQKTSGDIRRLDDIAFRKAGIGPLRKTYKEKPSGTAN